MIPALATFIAHCSSRSFTADAKFCVDVKWNAKLKQLRVKWAGMA
jgi:hypothetical protein